MSEAPTTSYDEIPYGSKAFPHTHPDFLATVGTLLGMTPAPVERCRVLELGCASGGNLIPMAFGLPEARFVGVDLSSRQIDAGQELIKALGLGNIDLRRMSILDIGEDLGLFDYIVCHGVYSWVPPEVQEKILEIGRRNLAPQGVIYVSYNTYPGWHLLGMVREMMGFHVGSIEDPRARVPHARGLIEFLAKATPHQDGVYGRFLKAESEALRSKSDWYLFHEHLEEVNLPVYYYQFAERSAAHGLQILREAFLADLAVTLRPQVRQTIQRLSADPIRQDQYYDFVCNRQFRRTLLCRAEVGLAASPRPETMAGLRAIGLARPLSSDPETLTDAVEEFVSIEGPKLTTNNPLVKTVLTALARVTPGAIPFDDLCALVRAHPAQVVAQDPTAGDPVPLFLAEFLRQAHLTRLVDLMTREPPAARQAGERPIASPLARLQAARGLSVTNLRHWNTELTAFEQQLVQLLDGTRDRAALREILIQGAVDGQIGVDQGGQAIRDPAQLGPILDDALQAALVHLAGLTVLVG